MLQRSGAPEGPADAPLESRVAPVKMLPFWTVEPIRPTLYEWGLLTLWGRCESFWRAGIWDSSHGIGEPDRVINNT